MLLVQIVIGIISNLIIFPPSFLLFQLFRKSKSRYSRIDLVKKRIKPLIKMRLNLVGLDETAFNKEKSTIKKKRSKFYLPWWFKIIAYILSASFVAVSLLFVIIKGITFGDDKCRKWLTSFLFSILTSIFLTQPVQV